jgi:hypothetical protein
MRFFSALLIASILFTSCKKNSDIKYNEDAHVLHECERKLTDIIVTDIFSPPVASRIYVYPSLAAYEAARYTKEGIPSITSKMKGFEEMPAIDKNLTYDFTVASVKAFCTTAKAVIFSKNEMIEFEKRKLEELHSRSDEETFKRSVELGEKIASVVTKRLSSDNYKQTRGMERFEVKTIPGRWVPTRPDYADATEPHWPKIKTLVLDSSSQCNMEDLIPYSEDMNSKFWQEAKEVYETVKKITPEQEDISVFWDDNPFVSRHKGHLMFQDKKMTPGGHWMAICRVAATHKKLDFAETARAYALTSAALFDAFISCWDEKYSFAKVRPETVIFDRIDKKWLPILVTPSFPTYTSGHSTISAAAAEVLTELVGDGIAYTDSTELEYGLPIRSFTSFRQAASEASISRVYAGIHFRSDCEVGNQQGRKVGQLVIDRFLRQKKD